MTEPQGGQLCPVLCLKVPQSLLVIRLHYRDQTPDKKQHEEESIDFGPWFEGPESIMMKKPWCRSRLMDGGSRRLR